MKSRKDITERKLQSNEICNFYARSQNCEKRLLSSSSLSVCSFVPPSVRMEQLGSHRTDFQEIRYWIIFRISVEGVQVSLKSHKNNGYFTLRPYFPQFLLK